jgi:magnesium transporter
LPRRACAPPVAFDRGTEGDGVLQRMKLLDGRVVPDPEGNIAVYVDPTEQERRWLVDVLKLDEHTLASALDPNELARLEFEPAHLAVISKRPRNYSSEDLFVFRVTSIGFFLFADQLVIVASEDAPLFQGKTFAKVSSLQDLMLRVICSSIAHFIEHLKVINAVSDALEEQINASMQNKYLLNLFSLEKSLVYYLNAINSNGKLMERLKLSAAKLNMTTEVGEFLEDMTIENQQCYEQAEIYSNILASMMDARASIVNNNLNWLMKTLTTITIAIMMPTFVVSLFSMNVDFPGKNHPGAFWWILGLAAASVFVVRAIWWWKKW